MNELQLIEFDMFKLFTEICDKLDLKYYLICGSALGVVKYKGFIPWDDDLDVGLLRQDYEIFISKASKFLPEYYILESYHNSLNFPLLMTKMRDIRTTNIERTFREIDMVHSVYIDIFPLDGYPKETKDIKKLEKMKLHIARIRLVRVKYNINANAGLRTLICKFLFNYLGIFTNTAKYIEIFDKLASTYPEESSDYVCNHGNWQGKLEYAPKEQYGEGTWATFEGLKVRIPERYDEYLTQKYGDWRSDPPPQKQISGHDFMIVDTNRPYTDYIIKLGKGKIRLKTSAELLTDGITPPEGYQY